MWILELFRRTKDGKEGKSRIPAFTGVPLAGQVVVFTSGKGRGGKRRRCTELRGITLAGAGEDALVDA